MAYTDNNWGRQKSIFKKLLDDLSIEESRTIKLNLFGSYDPIIDSPYFIAEGFASILGAIGLTTSMIWKIKTNESQEITIDKDKILPGLYRLNFIDQNNYRIAFNEFYKPTALTHICKDGKFYETSSVSRKEEDGILEILKCANNSESITKAFYDIDSTEFDEMISKKGLCGSTVYTRDEWRNHPQGLFLSKKPPVEIKRLCSGMPKAFSKFTSRPLEGIKVLELTNLITGPTVGSVLSEHGAEILHISAPNSSEPLATILDANFGKKTAKLDLDDEAQLEHFKQLLFNADIFVHNYPLSWMEEKGLLPKNVAKINPNIIYVDITAYGNEGPWKERRGTENTVQASIGVMTDQGTESEPYPSCAGFLLSYSTGYFGALGAIISLIRRAKFGGSYLVSVSLAKTGMWYQDLGMIEKEILKELKTNYKDRYYETLYPTTSHEINKKVQLLYVDTSFGPILHMSSLFDYSITPTYWSLPVYPLGYHTADWRKTITIIKKTITSIK